MILCFAVLLPGGHPRPTLYHIAWRLSLSYSLPRCLESIRLYAVAGGCRLFSVVC